ncbi:MAG TPA: MFS transporter [Opitutaceae bacterium]|nr:MFS transporter [Opitutaceae bacterium]
MDRVVTLPSSAKNEHAAFGVLVALSVSHLLNDTIQGMLPAIYPLLKTTFALSFTQIGLITLVFQGTASLLQPLVGTWTDRRPMPYSLGIGMSITMIGIVILSQAGNFTVILLSSALIGFGSAVFHPEASRLARLASGGRHGFAQSLFQVGGNLGSSLGPLLAAAIVMSRGQVHTLWFTLLAIAAIAILVKVGGWYQRHLIGLRAPRARPVATLTAPLSRAATRRALVVLMALVFSKYIYLSSLTSYFTFYLIDRFHVRASHAQILLFLFLFAVAAGTIIGGPVGDRFGRKIVIWISILGVAPFALLLPHVGLAATTILSMIIGLILASAFSAILVYAQELVPGKVGLISGLFFGFAFGMGGLGSAFLGRLADHTSIQHVFHLCAYLPLIGLLTVFLPDLSQRRA